MQQPSKKRYRTLFFDRALKNNLVLVEGIGLCPLIGGATTLKNSVAMFLCATVTLIITNLLMMAIGKKMPSTLRIPVHTLCASALLCGEAYFINALISTELYASLYLFLPLLAVTTLFAYHGDNVVGAFDPRAGFVDAFSSAFGFGVVLCLIGGLREIVAKRTIWDTPLPIAADLPQVSLPFAAFLLLGLLAALLQHANTAGSDRKRHSSSITGGGTYDDR